MNIKMIISYDGSAYFGWQKTRTGPSIQETLENALFKILRTKIPVEATSRTDRGVHARGQVVHFILENETDLSRLHYSLNAVLPSDIRVVAIEQAYDTFHPTLDATGKEYRYRICLGPIQNPIHRHHSWHVPQVLDLDAMRISAEIFKGTHDFASFTTEKVEDSIRTLFDLRVQPINGDHLEIHILGDRFLYKMARRIVGTLVAIGKHKLRQQTVAELFKVPNRAMAGMTAPAHGLFLHKVFYFANITSQEVESLSEKVTL